MYFAPPPVISGDPAVEGEPEKAPVTTLAKPLPSQPTWPIMFGLKIDKKIPKFKSFFGGLNLGLSSVHFSEKLKLICCFKKVFIY